MTSSAFRDVQYSRMLVGLGIFMSVGLAIAVRGAYGVTAGAITLLLGVAILTASVWRTRLEVVIDHDGVRCGRAHIDWAHIGSAEALDREGLRRAIGPDAHPRDFLQIRGTDAALRVWLRDDADPCRCWIASVSDAQVLADWLKQHAGAAHAA